MSIKMCEQCHGKDLVKEDGMYVCSYCGAKYSVSEIERTPVSVSNSNSSTELDNLYQVARRARDTKNSENAQKFYEQILIKDPSSWEANFYSVYFQSMNCVIADICSAANNLTNLEEIVIKMVYDSIGGADERRKTINEISCRLIDISKMFTDVARNHYLGIDSNIRMQYNAEYAANVCAARDILFHCGDCIIKIFGDDYCDLAIMCWEVGIVEHKSVRSLMAFNKTNKDIFKTYSAKVKTYRDKLKNRATLENNATTNTTTATKVTTSQPEAKTAFNQKPISKFKDIPIRKGMKVGMIVCFIFACIYGLMAMLEPAIFGGTLFFGILSLMFLFLGVSPKESQNVFIKGKESKIKKKTFVAISILIAFILFGVCMSNMPTDTTVSDPTNSQSTTVNNKEKDDKTEEEKITQNDITLNDIQKWYNGQTASVSQSLLNYSKTIKGLTSLNVDSSKFRFGEEDGWYDCHYTFQFTCVVNGETYPGEARAFLRYEDDAVEWFHFEIFQDDATPLVEHYDDSYDKIIEDYYKDLAEKYN